MSLLRVAYLSGFPMPFPGARSTWWTCPASFMRMVAGSIMGTSDPNLKLSRDHGEWLEALSRWWVGSAVGPRGLV